MDEYDVITLLTENIEPISLSTKEHFMLLKGIITVSRAGSNVDESVMFCTLLIDGE